METNELNELHEGNAQEVSDFMSSHSKEGNYLYYEKGKKKFISPFPYIFNGFETTGYVIGSIYSKDTDETMIAWRSPATHPPEKNK